ncbi:YsnF/AvaK domain-containing protein [Psychrobacter sp.]|uniref:YsnF/AvaK domain-containing protein n=1 Tax=Psychrobacter sp. TaxID=56811 RepID=UPI00356B0E85
MNANNENNYPNANYPDFTATTASDAQDDSTLSEQSQKQSIIGKQQDPLLENSTDTNNRDGGYLELLEERPVVNKERLDVGKVTVTKHFRTKTIDVPIELIEEYITVRTEYQDTQSQDLLSENYDDKDILRHVEPSLDSKAVVTINGNQVEIGDAPIEIVLSRQIATITKDTYVVQEVAIEKTTHTHTDSIEVELKHEELDVTEEGFLAHDQHKAHKR